LGGGIERSHLKRILATVPERPFDFYQRVSIVDDRMRMEADSRGQQHHPLIILDGLELEVFVMTKQGPMKFTEWNPGQVVSHYSKHDTSIKSLDSYLDLLATFYGRSSLGL
jgi:hypothetical protein